MTAPVTWRDIRMAALGAAAIEIARAAGLLLALVPLRYLTGLSTPAADIAAVRRTVRGLVDGVARWVRRVFVLPEPLSESERARLQAMRLRYEALKDMGKGLAAQAEPPSEGAPDESQPASD